MIVQPIKDILKSPKVKSVLKQATDRFKEQLKKQYNGDLTLYDEEYVTKLVTYKLIYQLSKYLKDGDKINRIEAKHNAGQVEVSIQFSRDGNNYSISTRTIEAGSINPSKGGQTLHIRYISSKSKGLETVYGSHKVAEKIEQLEKNDKLRKRLEQKRKDVNRSLDRYKSELKQYIEDGIPKLKKAVADGFEKQLELAFNKRYPNGYDGMNIYGKRLADDTYGSNLTNDSFKKAVMSDTNSGIYRDTVETQEAAKFYLKSAKNISKGKTFYITDVNVTPEGLLTYPSSIYKDNVAKEILKLEKQLEKIENQINSLI